MSKVSIIFCNECKSTQVESGFETESNLRCCKCGNEKKFTVGKVSLDKYMTNVEELIEEAKKDARY